MIPNGHDLNPCAAPLKRDGTMVLVGALTALEPPLQGIGLIAGRRRIAVSAIGGMAETQEMLDFRAKHGIVSDIEMIPIPAVNEAYERLLKNDVRYRFVIDMATLKHGSIQGMKQVRTQMWPAAMIVSINNTKGIVVSP